MSSSVSISGLSQKALRILQNTELSLPTQDLVKSTLFRSENFSPVENDSANLLTLQRLAASNTLFINKDTVALQNWLNANQLLNEFILSASSVTGHKIKDLHRALLPSADAFFRSSHLQGGNGVYPPPEDLNILWGVFLTEVLNNPKDKNPIFFASQIYQWLVSLHFFEDANGRLARLSADWVLTASGIPPLSFANDAASFVSVLDEQRNYDTNTAVIRVCQGIQQSLDILEQK